MPPVPTPVRPISDASRFPSSSWPTTPIVCTRPPIATMLLATFAAPPRRYSSRSYWTTGTGASGEMRSTRPTTKWSSITSPTIRIDRPAIFSSRSCTCMSGGTYGRNSGGRGGGRAFGGVGKRDDDEKQHQEFRVVEIVFKHAGGHHRDDAGEPRGSKRRIGGGPAPPQEVANQRDDEPDPHRDRRQPAFGGDLQRHVVEVRIQLPHGLRIAVGGVDL